MDDLLPKVEVYRLSESALQELADRMRDVVRHELANHNRNLAGGLRAAEAAAYIGVSRSTFYELLEKHPDLKAASFKVGRARVYPKEALDQWIRAQGGTPAPGSRGPANGAEREAGYGY